LTVGAVVATLLVGPTATVVAQDASPAPSGDVQVAYVLHGLNAFTEVIGKGAEDAGAELGVAVQVTGPARFDPQEQTPLFEAAVQQGVDGIAVVPQPGDVWVTPIQGAIDAGIPVATANVTSPDSAAPLWVGQDEYQSGVILAEELRGLLDEAGVTEGTVVAGACAPGVDVLVDRYDGLVEGMEGTGFEVSEAQDVTPENTTNYAAWENLATANPDAVAMVGLCSLDIPNLAQLKTRNDYQWIVAGYDLNVETLDAIRAGTAQVTVGQQPYLQGYLPVRALAEAARAGTPLVEGWIETPTEVVTADNVDDVYEREANEEAETAYYRTYIAEEYPDLTAAVKGPIPGSSEAEAATPTT
jgi:simple sugar transport system substrate-binding protein